MAHEGFAKVAKSTGSPALTAWIGRKLYGKKKFQEAASRGKPLSEKQRLPEYKGKKGKKTSAPNLPAYRGRRG